MSAATPPPPAITNWRAAKSTEQLQRQFSDPDFDDSTWTPIDVPSHWQTNPEFADFDGTLLYRADITVPTLQPGQRRWLRFGGLCYAGDVFLDGVYVGQTEGYFTHHRFEITDLVAKPGTSVLAIEVAAPSVGREGPKRELTGWFTEGPGIPPGWNPAGIWQPVELVDTGPVAIRHFRALCTAADTSRAEVTLRAVLMAAEPGEVELTTEVAAVVDTTTHTVAAGENRVEWQVHVDNPALWWPAGGGDQPLHDLRVSARIADGSISDRKHRRIGFRSTSMRDFILRVNNHRTFIRGINIAPLALDLASVSVEAIRAEVEAIRDAGFNLVRIRCHVTRREFIEACDEFGVMVWQDLPLVGSYARSITSRAEQQVRDMIDLLSHHPAIVLWGGHLRPHTNEPRTTAAPDLRQQQVPSWNRTVLDRAIRRAFRRDDPSRTVIAHSDVAPHVPHLSGSDVGLYFGWLDGRASDIVEYAATLPRLIRFVSDMGAQALPSDLSLDLDRLLSVSGAETDALRATIPPTTYPDPDSWAEAMRAHQADVLKAMIETLRVLKYQPCGGFCAGLWRGVAPGLTRGLVDADGTPRPALTVATKSLRPLLPVLYPATPSIVARTTSALGLHLCNDSSEDIEVRVTALVTDHRGQATRTWTGIAPADDVVFLGDLSIRGGRIGTEAEVVLHVVDVGRDEDVSSNRYVYTAV